MKPNMVIFIARVAGVKRLIKGKPLFALLLCVCLGMQGYAQEPAQPAEVLTFRKKAILDKADKALQERPVTITAFVCPRSAGDRHEFYSEGDYWWPDPKHPDGPYIQRDGETNPENFVEHRHAMIRLSQIMGDLAAAYLVTHDKKYLEKALQHALAWFVDTATLMRPNLQYAQAIKGRVTGRGIGIIDTIQLLEVAQALRIMEEAGVIPAAELQALKAWFSEYERWLVNSDYGKAEMNAKNNHGTCWALQAAAFARFTNNEQLLEFCRRRYREVFLPKQMATDGSFPLELARTKPYGYSLFNLDAMAGLCQILSDPQHDLWSYSTADGRGIRQGIRFMYPYVADKGKWPYRKDVMHWESWPVAQPFLVFGAVAFHSEDYLRLWERLDHDPQDEEVIRNLPIRHPVLWLGSR
ncbi:alginate lyase family protein [Compostibacter hankyongensis]|uniref:Alginate lyase family protein n=1 Tax=Compostibacter hankyongensis TaxID=1007089 RepID=A0ABP8FC55_9BACT